MAEQRPDRTPRKNGRPTPNGSGPGGGGLKLGRGLFGWILFIGVIVMLFVFMKATRAGSTTIDLSELKTQFDNGNVAKITIEGDTLKGNFNQPVTLTGPAKVTNFRANSPPIPSRGTSPNGC